MPLCALSRSVGITVGLLQADRKSTRLNSSHMSISYAVFCLKKKNLVRIDGGSYVMCVTCSQQLTEELVETLTYASISNVFKSFAQSGASCISLISIPLPPAR